MSVPPPGQANNVANTFMDSMKTQPLALALCVMNIALLAVLFYIAHSAHDNHATDLQAQKELYQLLARCGVSDK